MHHRTALALLLLAPGCFIEPDRGGQSGEHDKGEEDGCIALATAVIDIDATLGDGTTPRQVLAVAEGEHAATLTYTDGTSTPVVHGVAWDGGEVRVVQYGVDPEFAGDTGVFCDDEALEIDAVFTFRGEDGKFDESNAVVLKGDTTRVVLSADWSDPAGTFVPPENEDGNPVALRADAYYRGDGTHNGIVGASWDNDADGDVSSSSRMKVGDWE